VISEGRSVAFVHSSFSITGGPLVLENFRTNAYAKSTQTDGLASHPLAGWLRNPLRYRAFPSGRSHRESGCEKGLSALPFKKRF